MKPSKLVGILCWIPAIDTEKVFFLFLTPLQNFVSFPAPKTTLKWNSHMFTQLKKLSRHPHHLFSSGINSVQRETKQILSLVNYAALFWHALCWFISQNCIYSDCSWHSADLCCTPHHTSLLGKKKKRISAIVLRPNCIFIIICRNFPGLSSSYLQPLAAFFPAERKHRALWYCIRGAFLTSTNSHQLRSYLLICLLLPVPFIVEIYFFFSGNGDFTFS